MKYIKSSSVRLRLKEIFESNRLLKQAVYNILRFYHITLGGLLYSLSKKYAGLHGTLIHVMEWGLAPSKPSSYKHEINLYNWRYHTYEVEFAELAFGRMMMRRDDVVLDLCSGDGSYSYLFFSDISRRVDAIDFDPASVRYARRNFSKPNLNYICGDVLRYQYKESEYDLIVWASGVAYFSPAERELIFRNIFRSLKRSGKVYLRTPLELQHTRAANQKSVIVDKHEFEREFIDFRILYNHETYYQDRTNLNYVLERRPSTHEIS